MYVGRSLSVSGSVPVGSGGNGTATFCCRGKYGLGDSGVGERLQYHTLRSQLRVAYVTHSKEAKQGECGWNAGEVAKTNKPEPGDERTVFSGSLSRENL